MFKLFTPDLVTSEAKAPDLQGAGLGVQGELPQVHLTSSRYCQTLGIGNLPCRSYSDKTIGNYHLVQIGILPIEKIGIGPPNFGQKIPVHRELSQIGVGVVEGQSEVGPSGSQVFRNYDYFDYFD